MAVVFIGGGHISGLSSDIKPVTDIPVNTIFTETDTLLQYRFNGTSWISLTEANVKDVMARDFLQEILIQLKILNFSISEGKIKPEDVE